MSENLVRSSENIPNIHKTKEMPGNFGKTTSRVKSNALGDVRNILHSRLTSNNNLPGKSEPQKSKSTQSRPLEKESLTSSHKSVLSEKKIPKLKSEMMKNKLCCPKFNVQDIHSHNLCEEADKTYFNNLMSEYKLSDREIDNLVKNVKTFELIKPMTNNLSFEPYEDVEFFEERSWENEDALSNDSFDVNIPDISPPKGVVW